MLEFAIVDMYSHASKVEMKEKILDSFVIQQESFM
jgi:hypothetical protein